VTTVTRVVWAGVTVGGRGRRVVVEVVVEEEVVVVEGVLDFCFVFLYFFVRFSFSFSFAGFACLVFLFSESFAAFRVGFLSFSWRWSSELQIQNFSSSILR